jgi:hypothetical protein
MSIKLQVINCCRSGFQLMNRSRLSVAALVAAVFLVAPGFASAQEQTQTPPSTQQQQAPPAGTATTGRAAAFDH